MENIMKQFETEHIDRRDSDKILFAKLEEIKGQQEVTKENMNEKVNEIKTTLVKWGGIATGALLVITALDKIWSHLAK